DSGEVSPEPVRRPDRAEAGDDRASLSRGSTPDYENVAIRGPTVLTRPSRGSTGWRIGIGGTLGLLVLGSVAFVSWRSATEPAGVQHVVSSPAESAEASPEAAT